MATEMPDGLNAIDIPTIAMIRPSCQLCLREHFANRVATLVSFVTCKHGCYTYHFWCRSHWTGREIEISGRGPVSIKSVTFDFYDGRASHICKNVTWGEPVEYQPDLRPHPVHG